MNCHDCFLVIDEYHDGELNAHTAQSVNTHLQECDNCRIAYQAANEALQFEQTEIYACYERRVELTPALWSAVQERLAAEQATIHSNSLTGFKAWCASVLFAMFQPPQFAAAAAAAAAVLVVTALFGYLRSTTPPSRLSDEASGYRVVAPPEGSDQTQLASVLPAPDNADESFNRVGSATMTPRASDRDRLLLPPRGTAFVKAAAATKRKHSAQLSSELSIENAASATAFDRVAEARFSARAEEVRDVEFDAAEHIERTELLLRLFRNIDPSARGSIGEVARERRQSKRLLFDNILLRRSAAINGNAPVAEVLGSVEPLLIDIANLPDRPSASDIDSIKNRIQRKEMVATLQAHHTLAVAAATSFGY